MKLLSGTAIVTTVALVCWTDSKLDSWEGEQQVMADKLLSSSSGSLDQLTPLQEWDDLPANVQHYLSQVVPNHHHHQQPTSTIINAFSVQQEGEFLMKKDQYVPFTAKEVFAVNPPGFSWEAKIAMAPFAPSWFPKLFVKDSWVDQVGHFQAAVQAIVPVLGLDSSSSIDNKEDPMTLGQATRWLADAVLLPSTLQPSAGMVTWKVVDDANNKAILELSPKMFANVRGLQLEATFDSTSGLLTQVTGTKPFFLRSQQRDFEMKTWQVHFSEYQQQHYNDMMMVPMKMESGWINEEGDFEAHYKIDNHSLEYHSGAGDGSQPSITTE